MNGEGEEEVANFTLKSWVFSKPLIISGQSSVLGPYPVIMETYGYTWLWGLGYMRADGNYQKFGYGAGSAATGISENSAGVESAYVDLYDGNYPNSIGSWFVIHASRNNGIIITTNGKDVGGGVVVDSAPYPISAFRYFEFSSGDSGYQGSSIQFAKHYDSLDNRCIWWYGVAPIQFDVVGNDYTKIGPRVICDDTMNAIVFVDQDVYKVKKIINEASFPRTQADLLTGDATDYPTEVVRMADTKFAVQMITTTSSYIKYTTNSGASFSDVPDSDGLYVYAGDSTYIYCSNLPRGTAVAENLVLYRWSVADGWELLYTKVLEGSSAIQGMAVDESTGDIGITICSYYNSVYYNYAILYTDIAPYLTKCDIITEINPINAEKTLIEGNKLVMEGLPIEQRMQILDTSDVVRFDGYCTQVFNNRQATFESVQREIVRKDSNLNETAKTAAELFTILLTGNTETFSGTLSAGGNTYTQMWSSFKQAHCMLTLSQAKACLFRCFIDNADSDKTKIDLIALSGLTSSGYEFIDANRSTYGYTMFPIESSDRPEAASKLILVAGENSNGIIQKTFGAGLPEKIVKRPDIIDATLAVDYGTQIYTDRNATANLQRKFIIRITKSAPYIKVGDTVKASFAPQNIAEDTFIVLKQTYSYNLLQSELIVSKTTGAQPLLENNSQRSLTTPIVAADNDSGDTIVPDSDASVRAGHFTNSVQCADPTALNHAVTLGYLLNNIALNLFYWLLAEDSDLVGYETMCYCYGGAETNVAVAIAADGTAVQEFATRLGEPGTILIRAGTIIEIHCEAHKSAGTKGAELYCKLYHSDQTGGSQTQIGNDSDAETMGASRTEVVLHIHVTADTQLTDKRVILKFFGNETGSGTNPTITLYYNTSLTHIGIPVDSSILGRFVLNDGLKTQIIQLFDNNADSLLIKQGANLYMQFSTVAGSTKVLINQTLDLNSSDITNVDALDANEITSDEIAISDQLSIGDGVGTDFKKQKTGVIQWGTSGAPTGITETLTTCEVTSTTGGHTYPLVCTTSTANQYARVGSLGGLTEQYIALWIRPAQVNTLFHFWVFDEGVGTCARFSFDASGNITVLNTAGAEQTICAYAADTWYHCMLYFKQNTELKYWLNGVLVFAEATAPNRVIDSIYLHFQITAAATTAYYDAFYYGTSAVDAWATYFSSPLKFLTANDGIITPNGPILRTIAYDMVPNGNKTINLGSANFAFDNIYADDFQNVASETKSRYIEPTRALSAIVKIKKAEDSEQSDYGSMEFAEPFEKDGELHHKRSLVKNLDYNNSAIQKLAEINEALEQRVQDLEARLKKLEDQSQ
jgi:hypothetical protein